MLPIFQARVCLLLGIFVSLAGIVCAGQENCTIAVGRDLYKGHQSRALVHGSAGAWEGLTFIDGNMQARPWLAQSWSSTRDCTVWTFILRPDVSFHNNTNLKAEHVVQCIQRIMDNPRYDPAGIYDRVESIQAHGCRRVVFHLAGPDPAFPKKVAYFSSPIVHPDGLGQGGNIKRLIATGGYTLEKAMPGNSLHLQRFPDYWGKKPLFPNVTFQTITDAETRVMALESGQVDAIADIGVLFPEQAKRLQAKPDIEVKKVNTATTHLMVFHCAKAPFENPEHRLWLGGTIDRKLIVEAIAQGAGRVAKDPYSDLSKEYSFELIDPKPISIPEGLKKYNQEIILLSHSGTVQRWPYLEMVQVVSSLLRQHGLKTKIRIQEPGSYHDCIQEGQYHLLFQPYTILTGEPDYFYAYWIDSQSPWSCGWDNLRADRLIHRAEQEVEPTKRKALYKELAYLMAEELPVLPLYHDQSFYAYRRELGSFDMDHFFRPKLMQ
jgi:peptide/nickel transport system substrate-binding protein